MNGSIDAVGGFKVDVTSSIRTGDAKMTTLGMSVQGDVVGIQLFGAGGLPSGEALVTIAAAGTGTITLRLGGPGTNDAGIVTNAQFESRALRLVTAYCQKLPVDLSYAEIGQSLPDIQSVDGI